MSTERTNPSDKELWRSLAVGRDVAPAPLSDLDFAAWLEGRLSETAAARIEAAVAAERQVERQAERAAGRAGLFGWLFAKDRRFGMQRVVALTAAVVIAVSGF